MSINSSIIYALVNMKQIFGLLSLAASLVIPFLAFAAEGKVEYSTNGKIESIGGKRVEYRTDGRLQSIGQ